MPLRVPERHSSRKADGLVEVGVMISARGCRAWKADWALGLWRVVVVLVGGVLEGRVGRRRGRGLEEG